MKFYRRYIFLIILPILFLFSSNAVLAAPIELSLEDSVALALKNNQKIKIAEAGKDKARWGIEHAEAGKGFTLAYTHTDSRTDRNPYVLPNNPTAVSPYNTYGNQLSLNLPIYTGGKLESSIDAAKLNYKVADLNVASNRQQIKMNATIRYFGVLQASNLLEVAKQSVADFEDHFKYVQEQFNAGTVAKLDVLQTEVQVAKAQDSLIKAKNSYELAVANLNNIIGMPLDSEVGTKDILNYQTDLRTLEQCVNYGLTHRPEMAAAEANIAVAQDQKKVAKGGYLPTLTFNATNGWSARDFPGAKNSNWTVALSANINLFDSGLTKSEIKKADDAITIANGQAKETYDNISLQIRQTYLSMKEAEKRIDTNNVVVRHANENSKMAKIRYEAGLGTNIDVVDDELSLIQARMIMCKLYTTTILVKPN